MPMRHTLATARKQTRSRERVHHAIGGVGHDICVLWTLQQESQLHWETRMGGG